MRAAREPKFKQAEGAATSVAALLLKLHKWEQKHDRWAYLALHADGSGAVMKCATRGADDIAFTFDNIRQLEEYLK